MPPIYIRDGRAPIPKNKLTSRIMSRIRAKDTKPELRLRKALSSQGIRGYRLHHRTTPGRPDISFIGKKIAIFVHGCFWHRCPHCQLDLPKSHSRFWRDKFKNNVDRDARKEYDLKENGWNVMVFWECQINKDLENIVNKIDKIVQKRGYVKKSN
jgi:DNA mismatch endonuclease (patch repair protein)